jgi:hypothetical protein
LKGGIPLGELERLFNDEVIARKRESYGNRARTGKSGSRSRKTGILPIDRMSRKERKEYTKAGEVVISNMYETILDKKEFELKPKELQKTMMTRWREIYSNEKIMQEMGISANNTFYALIRDLDVPQKKRGGFKGRNVSTQKSTPATPPAQKVEQVVTQLVTNGLHLEYNGKYDAEQLEKIFTKLQLVVNGEDSKYRLSISLSEIDG